MREKPNNISLFTKNIDVYECRFFLSWLEKQLREILKSELKIKRKGLPKSGTHPMVRNKQLLALAKTLKKFKLKDFAEEFGTSYGVVRVWNREKAVEEKTENFRYRFADKYVHKLKELSSSMDFDKYGSESYQDSQAQIIKLYREARHYHGSIQGIIRGMLEYFATADDRSFWWTQILRNYNNVLSSWHIYNPPKDKKSKAEFEQIFALGNRTQAKLSEKIFDGLKESIKNHDIETAINLTDFLSTAMSELIYEKGVLGLSVINKGKRRVSKDLERLCNAAKNQTN